MERTLMYLLCNPHATKLTSVRALNLFLVSLKKKPELIIPLSQRIFLSLRMILLSKYLGKRNKSVRLNLPHLE